MSGTGVTPASGKRTRTHAPAHHQIPHGFDGTFEIHNKIIDPLGLIDHENISHLLVVVVVVYVVVVMLLLTN